MLQAHVMNSAFSAGDLAPNYAMLIMLHSADITLQTDPLSMEKSRINLLSLTIQSHQK